MRIIQGTNTPKPSPEAQAAPAPDLGRVEALEKIAKSILQKIQALEERVDAVEKTPPIPAPAQEPIQTPLSTPPIPSMVTFDSNTIKKGLLNNMWKYLHDSRPAKTA
jgi:hypothetical protein